MRVLIWFLLPFLLCSQENIEENERESFISEYEYGQMLYANPRGVSCSECHGKYGEGKLIIQYQDRDEKKEIRGSDIRNKSLSVMVHALNSYHKIMPRYYLTDDEVEAISNYLKKKYKKDLKKRKKNSTK